MLPRLISIILSLLLLAACAPAQPEIRASLGAVEAVNRAADAGFARVSEPRPFVFPRDHGPHPEYAIEWWYYTGNLRAADGRLFGFQLTFFRSGLAPNPPARQSNWATSDIYMAHFAVSDIGGEQFFAFDRFSRDAAGLAGATGEPFRVFLEDWSVEGSGPEGMTMRLRAAEGPVSIDLTATSTKSPALQGDRGLSQKGPSAGNASYYYSLTRMATEGTVTINGQPFAVSGLAWMDHEFGTSALEGGAVGWDWFALQLDDGRDLMYAQVRTTVGISSSFGSLVAADGTTSYLASGDVLVEVLDLWRSPRSGAVYPSHWRLSVPAHDLNLEITPALADQELPLAVVYWEGAVTVSGSAGGVGYVELTGYGDAEDVLRRR